MLYQLIKYYNAQVRLVSWHLEIPLQMYALDYLRLNALVNKIKGVKDSKNVLAYIPHQITDVERKKTIINLLIMETIFFNCVPTQNIKTQKTEYKL